MSKVQWRRLPPAELQIKKTLSRRDFARSSAIVAAGFAASSRALTLAQERPSAAEASPIRLGLASYTFRNFARAHMIGFMKQLNVIALNTQRVKDHLPRSQHDGAAAQPDAH